MEDHYHHEMSENSGGGRVHPHHSGGDFSNITSSIIAPNNSSSISPSSSPSMYEVGRRVSFQLPTGSHHPHHYHQQTCFQQALEHSIVKTEYETPQHQHFARFYHPSLASRGEQSHTPSLFHHHHYQHPDREPGGGVGGGGGGDSHGTTTATTSSSSNHEVEAIKAKIISHPQYSSLLEAYLDCQKVGAPPEVAAQLAAAQQELEARQRASFSAHKDAASTTDPDLDQFMEAYYDMLVKYREELTRPVQEAMDFMRRIEAQLNVLSNGRVRVYSNDDKSEGVGSSEEDQENSGGEAAELADQIDPRAEDRELKNHLLRKYSGYLSSLKQELSKKKKKGKLPKEARQKLLSWWELHYKWPYPSESEKVALAEATGLDQKQINNWFINQRKRHWKPSEDMQFMVMDGINSQNAATLYMDGHYIGDGPYRFRT